MKYFFIPFTLLLFSMLVACEDTSSEEYLADSVPVSFTPVINDHFNLGTAATRASGTTWTAGDKVGIYMVAAGTGNPTLPGLAGNYQYQVAANKTSLTEVSTPIYYPVNGSGVNFVAYYPYKSSFTTAHTYPVNVTTQSPLSAIDLLYCARTSNNTPYSRSNPNASLTFKHQLVSLKVNVKGDTSKGITASHMANPAFTITGMPRQATFPLATGVLSAGTDVGNITPVRNTGATGASTTNLFWEGILVPNSSGSRSFVFSLGGTTYTYPITQSFVAGNEYTFTLTLTPSGIIVNSINITGWNVGGAAWDGKYALTVGESSVTHNAAGAKVGGSAGGVNVNYNTVTKPTASTATSWIKNVSVGTGTDAGNGFKKSTLQYTVDANTATTARAGTINITAEGLTIPVTVNQGGAVVEELANCYIVYPTDAVSFPVTRAYQGPVLDANYTGNFSVTVLWDENNVINSTNVTGTGKSARISVVTKNNEGNALVALKNQSGTIVWSYHIWVTTYDPNKSTWQNSSSTGSYKTFMTRNLGGNLAVPSSSATAGMYYQWGRNEPFAPSLIGSYPTSSGDTYLTGASALIQTPTTLYYHRYSMKVWGSNIHNWNSTVKSISDPCPAGWTVPISNVSSMSTDSMYGMKFDSMLGTPNYYNTIGDFYWFGGGTAGISGLTGSIMGGVNGGDTSLWVRQGTASSTNAMNVTINQSGVTLINSVELYTLTFVRCVKL